MHESADSSAFSELRRDIRWGDRWHETQCESEFGWGPFNCRPWDNRGNVQSDPSSARNNEGGRHRHNSYQRSRSGMWACDVGRTGPRHLVGYLCPPGARVLVDHRELLAHQARFRRCRGSRVLRFAEPSTVALCTRSQLSGERTPRLDQAGGCAKRRRGGRLTSKTNS
jgi:hypothetical protein